MKLDLLKKLTLRPIDFEKIDKHGKIGDELVLSPKKKFICLIDGNFHLGNFSPVWFGLNFHSGHPYQFDPYRTNCTGFQAIWEIVGTDEIAAELEPEYAEWNKQYCVEHGMRRNGRRITDGDPIESFKYLRNRPVEKDDDDE